MINIHFFLKKPVKFKEKFTIYPPSINEVYDAHNFQVFRKILTLSQEEIEDIFTEGANDNTTEIPKKFPTPFEFLLANGYHNKEVEKLTIAAFQFFIHEEISLLYDQKKILIGNIQKEIMRVTELSQLRYLEEEEYLDFQNLIRSSLGEEIEEPCDETDSPKIREMKAKARYRDKIKAKQSAKKGSSIEDLIVSICCMNLGLNPLNIGEMSYAAIPILTGKYQSHEAYDTDVRCLIGGGDPKKIKPKYWIGESDKK